MNKVFLIGRLTKDPEGKAESYARFTLAVDDKPNKDGEKKTNFISCVAFGKTGDFVLKWLKQGVKIALEGRITTGSYEKDGVKKYTTDVVAESLEFAESKKTEENKEETQETQEAPPPTAEGYVEVDADVEELLPWKKKG
jgi:single-strand DNA-binding protein